MTIKISIILLAIFSGWLFSEIKDFVVNGGFDNKLATVLLKIIFICNAILICILWEVICPKYFTTSEADLDTPTNPPESNNIFNLNKSMAKSTRSSSKTRRTRYTDHFNFNSDN